MFATYSGTPGQMTLSGNAVSEPARAQPHHLLSNKNRVIAMPTPKTASMNHFSGSGSSELSTKEA
jgi:hypothetical protein